MKLQLAPLGNPEHAKLTACLNPFLGVTVRFSSPELPAATFKLVLLTERAKSAVDAATTVIVIADDVELLKLVSPEYVAVRVCGPTVKFATLTCAEPLLNVAEATVVPESRNEIVPEGVPVPLVAATCAVNVTALPAVICAVDVESEVFVFTFAEAETVIAITADVDAAKFASPE